MAGDVEPPPLAGVRVLELAGGIAGPYGGRLLAMLGARVLKAEPDGGDPARALPLDDTGGSDDALYCHLNAGKRNASRRTLDLEAALSWADVVIADRARSQLAGTLLDPERLREREEAPALVTTTAWGFDADDPGRSSDDLLLQAAAGVMSLTGDRNGPPLRFPPWTLLAFAGAHVAASALAALRAEGFVHHDVPWLACAATAVEAAFSAQLQAGEERDPPGPHPANLYPSGALRCADGHVVPGTVRLEDWLRQCAVYGRPELADDERFRRRARRIENVAALAAEVEPWYAERKKYDIFRAALEASWALGVVLTAEDALADEHLAARGFLGSIESAGGPRTGPVQPWRTRGLPVLDQRVRACGEDDARIAAELEQKRPRLRGRPLRDLRVLELTLAWAGPFIGRYLGALGADVVKVESVRNYDGWRGPRRIRDAVPESDAEPSALSLDVAPNFCSMNRNKRQLVVDLASDAGRDVLLACAAEADVVVCNWTAKVLPKLRLAFDELCRVNPRLVLLEMPALGASGPYRDAPGYGSIIEGMGGFGARFGLPEEGARITQTFYPDAVAGIHGVVAVLAGLAQVERTGRGLRIDLSQQEVLWLQGGEAIVRASQRGRDPARMGNREPGARSSGVVASSSGDWVAVVSDDADLGALLASAGRRTTSELLEAVRARGGRAERVLRFSEASRDPRLQPWLERLTHPVTGPTAYLRVPLGIDGRPVPSRGPAPVFGVDTREVLGDWLGWSAERIDALVGSGAVGGVPELQRREL